MIRRIDRIQTELPPPSDPDPAGAAAVQELMGGKFGEMSTFLNYTFQSFNFRNRQGARPFYDLVANIAAEEFGHIELVATTINTMLTGATPTTTDGRAPGSPLAGLKGVGNPHHFLAGGQGALPQNSQGRPWNGDYVFSSGDLVEDLTHNFFLETGARNRKLKVYEMVEHPAARALTGYLLVRGGVHQVAYARAIEKLTGANLMKMFPSPRIPTDKIPECKPHIKRGEHLQALPLLAERLPRARGRLQRPASRDRRGAGGRRRGARRRARARPSAAAGRVRARLRAGGDRRNRCETARAGGPPDGADGRGRKRQRVGHEQAAASDTQAESSREEVAAGSRCSEGRAAQGRPVLFAVAGRIAAAAKRGAGRTAAVVLSCETGFDGRGRRLAFSPRRRRMVTSQSKHQLRTSFVETEFGIAETTRIKGTTATAKMRNPIAAFLLVFVTFGIYYLVWYYKINRELRDLGRATVTKNDSAGAHSRHSWRSASAGSSWCRRSSRCTERFSGSRPHRRSTGPARSSTSGSATPSISLESSRFRSRSSTPRANSTASGAPERNRQLLRPLTHNAQSPACARTSRPRSEEHV